jgi:hypothetical protein
VGEKRVTFRADSKVLLGLFVFAKFEPLLGEIRAAYGPQFAASFKMLIDATPEGRNRVAAAGGPCWCKMTVASKNVWKTINLSKLATAKYSLNL